ncbi:condensation domain-containing protein, partial [Burkholderia gladioli]|uniref:condensation domain-containing protein n=1 Tax=Burkholderia gladioli TaxID=28095 RepID=UPI001ABBC734
SRVRQQWRIELPLRALFEDPTLASFARRIDGARPARAATPLVPIGRDAALRLSFGQQRLWFLEQLQPGNPAYHIPFAVRIDGALDVAAFEQAFSWLVARHETLRTRFAMHDGEPVQVIMPAAPVAIDHHALDGLDASARAQRIDALKHETASAPFDLTRDAPIRVSLARLGEQTHLALVTLHHIVADGWSLGLLVDEFATLYAAAIDGLP